MGQDSTRSISKAIQERMLARMGEMTEDELYAYLAQTVYLERKRLSQSKDETAEEERSSIESAAVSYTHLTLPTKA